MTSGIFYSARSFLGREGKNITRHLSIISNTCDKIDHLSNAKTDAIKEHFLNYGNLRIDNSINMFGDFYETSGVNMSTWMDVYDALDVKRLESYDKLFIIGGMDLWRSGLTRYGKRASVFPHDAGQIKFRSVGIHCCNILALVKAHNLYNIPLHELSYDPNEICAGLFHTDIAPTNDYYVYHGYDIPKYNMLRLDSLQNYFLTKSSGLFTKDKITDFTFGYTILEKSDREDFKQDINNILKNFNTVNLYVKDYQTGEDTTIDGDSYLDKLEESRFTFMLPSYDRHCFSGYRFMEAIANDCLPLIHPSCNFHDIGVSYNIDLKELITDTPPMESRRLELLEYLKEKIMIVRENFR